VIANYLVPEFGKLSLRDLTPLTLQRYFSGLATSPLAHESKDKIKDVLSSVLGSALQYGLLVKNPVEGIRLPPERRGKRKTKPHVTPEQFEQLAVNDFQAAANRSGPGGRGVAAENYGPAGLWQNGKPVRDAKLQNQFHDYIHILPPVAQEPK
jgi:hypothetical protein